MTNLNTCPYYEAKKAILKAEDDFSIMLDKGAKQCLKSLDSLMKKKEKLILRRKKLVEKKKLLVTRIKSKPTESSNAQLTRVKEQLSELLLAIKEHTVEVDGVKHGLKKIKSLQKQRVLEAKVLAKFRREQTKKLKKK